MGPLSPGGTVLGPVQLASGCPIKISLPAFIVGLRNSRSMMAAAEGKGFEEDILVGPTNGSDVGWSEGGFVATSTSSHGPRRVILQDFDLPRRIDPKLHHIFLLPSWMEKLDDTLAHQTT